MTDKARKFVETWFRDRNQDLLRYLRYRAPSYSEAEDIAQEAYVRLLRVDRIDLVRDPEAYLFRIAANVAYEHRLKARRSRGLGVEEAALGPELGMDGVVETRVDQTMQVKKLEAALADLSPKCRAAFVLHKRDGMTYREIGRKLGVSSNMIKKYLKQALSHCRRQMSGE